MALHKTGFPKEEATSRNGYLITAGSGPTQTVCFSNRGYSFPSLGETSVSTGVYVKIQTHSELHALLLVLEVDSDQSVKVVKQYRAFFK